MMEASVALTVTESGKNAPQYTLESDLNGQVTLADFLEYTKQTLIAVSDVVLKEEQAAGFDKNPVTVVDNKTGVPIQNVKALGKIEFVGRTDINDVVLETYQSIIDKSPVLSGAYKSSNYVFLNGTQVATDLPSLQAWLNSGPELTDKDLIRFVNLEPYARKLETLGVTIDRQQSRTIKARDKRRAARGIRVRVPNGTYYLTARTIRNKYKRNSTIKFDFISGSSLGISGSFKAKRGKPGRAYLYPSIIISVQESGIL